MAGASLLTLLDDLATLLDDVSVMTKIAAKKTAGVLGDDLALNAEQVAGVQAERELPVVWAVAKGSLLNKAILVPAALAISALVPGLITPLLMIGGAFLCFEGFEKVAHKLLHGKDEDDAHHAELTRAAERPAADLVQLERDKIKGAIRTDFVLSAEIITITLGAVADAAFAQRVLVLVAIAVIMTVGVYGFVAGIVKLDDLGLWLAKAKGARGALRRRLGALVLVLAPYLMRFLSIAGTAAMFMVGGGILLHGVPGAHDVLHHAAEAAGAVPGVGALLAAVVPSLLDAIAGVVAGAVVLGVVTLVARGWRAVRAPKGGAKAAKAAAKREA